MAQHALALLVGSTPASFAAPDFKLGEFHLPAALPLTVPSELAHRRPDILAVGGAVARRHGRRRRGGGQLYPQVSLSASASLQANAAQRAVQIATVRPTA